MERRKEPTQLEYFELDVAYHSRSKHKWKGGTVSFKPNKVDRDIVTLQDVLCNAVHLEKALKTSEKQEKPKSERSYKMLKALENFLSKNVATHSETGRSPYLSQYDIDLSDEHIISLMKFNIEIKNELVLQKEQSAEKDKGIGMGA